MLNAAAQWSKGSGRVSACSKEERKAKLAKAAEEMRETGKTEAAFADSSYAVRLPAPFKQCILLRQGLCILLRHGLCVHAATLVPSLLTHCMRQTLLCIAGQ